MPNYTQETASLKTITHDSTVIDTKILKINGELFNPSQIEGDYNSVVWKMTIESAINGKSDNYNVVDLD